MSNTKRPTAQPRERRAHPRQRANVLLTYRALAQGEFQRLLAAKHGAPTATPAPAELDSVSLQTHELLTTMSQPGSPDPMLLLLVKDKLQTLAHTVHPEKTIQWDEAASLSLSGIAFNASEPVAAGIPVELAVTCLGEPLRVTALGIVVYCRTEHGRDLPRTHRIGIDFVGVSAEDRAALSAYLSR